MEDSVRLSLSLTALQIDRQPDPGFPFCTVTASWMGRDRSHLPLLLPTGEFLPTAGSSPLVVLTGLFASFQLLLLDSMGSSGEEASVDAAQVLQHKIYYNAELLERPIKLLMNYKNQSTS